MSEYSDMTAEALDATLAVLISEHNQIVEALPAVLPRDPVMVPRRLVVIQDMCLDIIAERLRRPSGVPPLSASGI